jgi:outer membrane protein
VRRIALLLVLASACTAQTRRLTLEQAEALALQQQPRIQAARAQAEAARELPIEARSAMLPLTSIDLSGAGSLENSRIGAGALTNPLVYSRVAGGMSVSQLLTDFGRTSRLTASARYASDAQQSQADVERARVLIDVDTAFFSVLRAEAVLKVADETVAARQVLVEQVRALAASKLKSRLDVSFAEVSLDEARLLATNARNDLDSARARLSAALGATDLEPVEPVEDPNVPTLPPNMQDLVAQGLKARPEIAQLRAEVASAQSYAAAERALKYPAVHAVATSGLMPAGALPLNSHWAVAGLLIEIPVLNGHLFSARQREAEQKALAAQARLRTLETDIANTVRLAFLDASNARDRIAVTTRLQDQAGLALDLAQSRYQLGLGSIVELTQAQLSKTAAEIAVVTARYDYQARRAALDYEIGAKR